MISDAGVIVNSLVMTVPKIPPRVALIIVGCKSIELGTPALVSIDRVSLASKSVPSNVTVLLVALLAPKIDQGEDDTT